MPCSGIPEYNFTLYQGDDKTVKFRYKSDGKLVDLTGYQIFFETSIASLQQEASIPQHQTWGGLVQYLAGDKVRHLGIDYIAKDLDGNPPTIGAVPPSFPSSWTITEALGEVVVSFDRVDTLVLTQRRVKYEMVFWPTGLSGSKQTKFRGSINITPQVV